MRKLAYEYYLKNGSLVNMQSPDVGVNNTCASTAFYRYAVENWTNYANLVAYRCTSGGKTPNASRLYVYYLTYNPGTGQSDWHCLYTDDNSACFGLTRW